MKKIFGREPAAWLNLIATALALLGAYVIHLNTDQQGALNGIAAALVAIMVGVSTHNSWAPLVLGLLKAVILAALAWHFNVSPDAQALIFAAASAVLAMFSQLPTQAAGTRPYGQPVRVVASPAVVPTAPGGSGVAARRSEQ
jgi:drug/metabolite transporter (DMT)-like permease